MRVSGCTFLRNAEMLGYPFVQSIKSILPIVDEFVVALGPCQDNTEKMLRDIGDDRIKIINTQWNEVLRSDGAVQGYAYGQQKSIALFNCTGDWAFYLEGDEVIHENDLPVIRQAMEEYYNQRDVEALIFDYVHFYGNANTYVWSPAWYRTAPRIIRNDIPCWAPKGLFFLVMKNNKCGRYPKAVHTGAKIYHYGWVRTEEQMRMKAQQSGKYWKKPSEKVYEEIDPSILKEFTGTHPRAVSDWVPHADGIFHANPSHVLTKRERKHRTALFLERIFGLELSKKHYKLIKK